MTTYRTSNPRFYQWVLVLILVALFISVAFPARSTTSNESWSLRDVVRTLEPAVVWILADTGSGDVWTQGSGFIVHETGCVLTNAHVVDGADQIIVGWPDRFNRSEKNAEILAIDTNLDLAVLKIDGAHLPTLPIGSSSDAGLGDAVITLGYPVGDELGLGGLTVTRGVLSSLRCISSGDDVDLLQTDAAVTLGCSGGPLYDLDTGTVIGIIQGKGMLLLEGFNFAIPMDKILDFAELEPGNDLNDAVVSLASLYEPDISYPWDRSLDCWILADSARDRSDWGEALGNFIAAQRLDDEDPQTAYGLAESYAALDRPDNAIHWLERAFELGYTDFDGALESDGFDGFEDDFRFVELVESF
ncbi:MAG: trypsin-like peptidase domain-containing protein [bacterium]|nr:trypsin-like peptidase domain-containing protein [bacterium]